MSTSMEETKMLKNQKRWHQMDKQYFGRNYKLDGSYNPLVDGDEEQRFQAYAEAQNFVEAKNFYPGHRYGEAFGGIHQEVQFRGKAFEVNTIQSGEKPLITYEDKVGHEIVDWGSNTSAHGIPQIVRANHPAVRVIWCLIYVTFVGIFLYQAVLLIQKFNRNEKIVDIELKFEAAPFPAITLCNLNPYKGSQSKNAKMISKMVRKAAGEQDEEGTFEAALEWMQRRRGRRFQLDAFEGAMNTASADEVGEEDAGHRRRRRAAVTEPSIDRELLERWAAKNLLRMPRPNRTERVALRRPRDRTAELLRRGRAKRSDDDHHEVFFEMSYSECHCDEGEEEECRADKETKPTSTAIPDWCMCAFDRFTDDAWPCFRTPVWEKTECTTCTPEGMCPKGGAEASHAPCFCNTMMCIAWDGADILKLWEYYGAPPTEDLGFLEAMGFGGMTDEVAIVTRAKENMMFAMATLSMDSRRAMSYTKEEFIHKCSFNGKGCDIENDFMTLVDPTFGNCFTYNHNRSMDLISTRAGPSYGLRLLLFVGDDEMPTTEATGVRLTVHDKDQFPFPDTFGYSAQTGTISSFGLRKKSVSRLPAPYGACLPGGNMENFIYDGYEYSVEGCFRSCFQMAVLHACSCGDPRFPVRSPDVHCEAVDPIARKCLEARTAELGGMGGDIGCQCPQPCAQSMYDVTFSAANWPAPKLQLAPKACAKGPRECGQEYKKHGAMLEVFYEQLNFEQLVESSAYGWVNVMSDFGGQLGLWLGVSILTIFEFVFLIFNFSHVSISHQYLMYLQRKAEKERQKNG